MENLLIKIGVMLYVLLTLLDRFVTGIPDMLSIPMDIAAIALILAGMVQAGKKRDTNKNGV